jgi:hypothetical protein
LKLIHRPAIYYINRTNRVRTVVENATYYLPRWQTSPVFQKRPVNENFLNNTRPKTVLYCVEHQQAAITPFDYGPPARISDVHEPRSATIALFLSMHEGKEIYYDGTPVMRILYQSMIHLFIVCDKSSERYQRQ